MDSSGVADWLLLEVAHDPVGLALHAAQMAGGRLDELQLCARGRQLGDGLLQIGVGHLVRVPFRTVARQV